MKPLQKTHFLIVRAGEELKPEIADTQKQARKKTMAALNDDIAGVQVLEIVVDEYSVRDVTEDIWRDLPLMGGQSVFENGLIKWKAHNIAPDDRPSYGRDRKTGYRDPNDEHRLAASQLGVGRYK